MDTHLHTYAHTYAQIYTLTHSHAHVHIHKHTHKYTHTLTHTFKHKHTDTQIQREKDNTPKHTHTHNTNTHIHKYSDMHVKKVKPPEGRKGKKEEVRGQQQYWMMCFRISFLVDIVHKQNLLGIFLVTTFLPMAVPISNFW